MSAAVVAVGSGLPALAVAVAIGTQSDRRRRQRDPSPVPPVSAGGRPRSPVGVAVVAVAVALAVAVLGPALALAGALVGLVGRAALIRAARRRTEQAKDRAFPDLVDLFRIAVAAGHPVARCVEVVADRAPPAHRRALSRARDQAARGVGLAETLVRAGPELGPLGPSLVDALVSGHQTGAPLGPPLDRLAAAARHRRARAAETEARRLPVTMLFPLVGCILPAFVLLAVVPLLVASFGSLQR